LLILDADHVPTADILEKTVGFFQRDPNLFLVQTPHFFINPDPIEKNLDTFADMPGENEMFYRVIQKGLDFWNASFFCGSAGVIRRRCLDEIGGFRHQSITEDAETSLVLHARGYRSAYLGQPMVAALAPETFSGFVTQRMRWAQGMVQIFLLRNPLFIRGLTIWQRLSYLSDCLFWFFPFARLVYMLAPTAYLFFGLKIYRASTQQFLAYALPYFIASLYATSAVFGRTRWPFVSYVYEVMQSMFSISAVWQTLRRPRAPSFKVTPKGEQIERDRLSPLAGPFFQIFLVLNLAMAAGVFRIYFGNPLELPVVIGTMLWNLLNYLIILTALGALYERRQLRLTHRMPAKLQAELRRNDGKIWQGRVVDLSMGGARFHVSGEAIEALGAGALEKNGEASTDSTADGHKPGPIKHSVRDLHGSRTRDSALLAGETVHAMPTETESRWSLTVHNPSLGRPSRIGVVPRHRFSTGAIGLSFEIPDDQVFREIVSLVYGDSERWARFWNQRLTPVGVWRSLIILLLRGFVNLGRYLLQEALAPVRNLTLLRCYMEALPERLASGVTEMRDTWTRRFARLKRLGEVLYLIERGPSQA
jgi:cellulose synthase (UDP-forming)